MTVNTEDIYRAMGKVPCRVEGFWHEPGQECALTTAMMRADAPLTDWSAFGEIWEWAQANGHLTGTINGGMSVLGWVHLWLQKHPEQDFRETLLSALRDRLAALSEAVKE